jgi:hypothetical protein
MPTDGLGRLQPAMHRHALVIPVGYPPGDFTTTIPGYGSRLIGPMVTGLAIEGCGLEIGALDEQDAFNLAFDLVELLAGRSAEILFPLLCRPRRLVGYDGEPLDPAGEIASRWESYERDVDAAGTKPNTSAFARQLVAERDRYPWLKLSSDPERAADAIRKRLQRSR